MEGDRKRKTYQKWVLWKEEIKKKKMLLDGLEESSLLTWLSLRMGRRRRRYGSSSLFLWRKWKKWKGDGTDGLYMGLSEGIFGIWVFGPTEQNDENDVIWRAYSHRIATLQEGKNDEHNKAFPTNRNSAKMGFFKKLLSFPKLQPTTQLCSNVLEITWNFADTFLIT